MHARFQRYCHMIVTWSEVARNDARVDGRTCSDQASTTLEHRMTSTHDLKPKVESLLGAQAKREKDFRAAYPHIPSMFEIWGIGTQTNASR